MKRTLTILLILISTSSFAQIELQYENNLVLKVYINKFDPNQHVIDTCTSGPIQYYCLIDNSPWFGADMGMDLPKYQLDSLVFIMNEIKVSLDVSAMYNPTFSGTIDKRHFAIKPYGNEFVINGWFSDGAGTYCARWSIINGKQIRTLISNDEDECFN